MTWPKEIVDALDAAVREVRLVKGYTKAAAIRQFLDMAASMAVWRCKGEAAHLEGAYFWPYTPIGHLTSTSFGGTMERFTIGGPSWGHALDLLKEYVRSHASEICDDYKGKPMPYPHEL
jgi:hypothetical protein